MKKIDLFGFQVSLNFEKKNWDDPDLYSKENILKEKIFYFIILATFFIVTKQIQYFLGSENYKAGDVVKMNLYAPKNTVYRDENAKNRIVEQLVLNSGNEYLFVSSAEKHYISNLNLFFDKVEGAKSKKLPFSSYSFEKDTGVRVSDELIEKFIKLPNSQLRIVKSFLLPILEGAYKEGIYQEENYIQLPEDTEKGIDQLDPLSRELIRLFIVPNYLFDKERTISSLREKIDQIGEQLVYIKAGDIIAQKGEILTKSKLQLLEAAGIYSLKKNFFMVVLNLMYLVIISTLFFIQCKNKIKNELLNKNIFRSSFLILAVVYAVYSIVGPKYMYLIPFDAALYLLLILTNSEYTFVMLVFQLAFLLPIVEFDLKFFVVNFFMILYSTYLINKIRTRSEVLSIGIKIAIIKVMFFLLLKIFLKMDTSEAALKGLQILVAGLLSGMITLSLIPYFERTFNLLNVFQLLELGDLSNPILKRLSTEAPGTFQHSIMVATLSENAAEKIGADTIFTRVASYYHDIGKLKRPTIFIENQNNCMNPHEKISPFLSALIIKSHTKDGVELGKKYKIPREIREIMCEHHGTTLLSFFYNKAKKISPEARMDDFMYSGPKPKTKESAIIMLADSIEAAVRSLDEKTPVTISEMINKITNMKIEDNQLSEAHLTFREIEEIKKSFLNTLISMHHVRVKYPGQK